MSAVSLAAGPSHLDAQPPLSVLRPPDLTPS
jgi:hypothetical protein